MTRDPFSRLMAVCIAMAMGFPFVAFAQGAGQFDFVKGEVSVVNAQGQTRVARQGTEIHSGDTLVTGEAGRAQVRFSDGGYISLQPNTRFRIDEYNYRGTADGSEKGFFSLVKGGLRAITGAIGKINHGSYQMTTPVATIGIRGTHYSLRFCESDCFDAGRLVKNGLYANVGEGQISLSNRVGSLQLPQGRAGFVADGDSPPVPTDRSVQTRPAKIDKTVALRGREQEKEKEKEKEREPERTIPTLSLKEREAAMAALKERETALASLKERETITLDSLKEAPLIVLDASRTIAAGDLRDPSGLPTNLKDATREVGGTAGWTIGDDLPGRFERVDGAVMDATGGLVSYTDNLAPLKTNHGNTLITEVGGDALMAWGRWEGDGKAIDSNDSTRPFPAPQSLHYVFTATPTPAAVLTAGGTLSYQFIGATTVTTDSGITGAFQRGGLTLNLGASPTVDLNFIVSLADNKYVYDVQMSGITVNTTNATFQQLNDRAAVISGCNSSCQTSVSGAIGGGRAESAGFVYEIQDTGLGNIHGAAAFSSTVAATATATR